MVEVANQVGPAAPTLRNDFVGLANRCFHATRNMNFGLERSYATAKLKMIESELVALELRLRLATMEQILA